MNRVNCKICGEMSNLPEGISYGICPHCKTITTFPQFYDEQQKQLYDRAEHFRLNNEYDKALTAYKQLITLNPSLSEAYWGAVLSRFGIEYVIDPVHGKSTPTCNRVQYDSILEDSDYLNAIKYSTDKVQSIYRNEAENIAVIQKNILDISSKETPFDVFICCKECDNDGKRTHDSVTAQDIFYTLTDAGYRVFFARISLESKLGCQYEPYIFSALVSAKVMLVIGSKAEYFNSPWIKNEWSRYLALLKNDRQKLLIPCYRNMNVYDIPEELAVFQAQDMSRIGFIQDIMHGIKKVIPQPAHGNNIPEPPQKVIGTIIPTVETSAMQTVLPAETVVKEPQPAETAIKVEPLQLASAPTPQTVQVQPVISAAPAVKIATQVVEPVQTPAAPAAIQPTPVTAMPAPTVKAVQAPTVTIAAQVVEPIQAPTAPETPVVKTVAQVVEPAQAPAAPETPVVKTVAQVVEPAQAPAAPETPVVKTAAQVVKPVQAPAAPIVKTAAQVAIQPKPVTDVPQVKTVQAINAPAAPAVSASTPTPIPAGQVKPATPSELTDIEKAALLRVKLFLEKKEFTTAKEYCQQLITQRADNAQAYFYLLLAKNSLVDENDIRYIHSLNQQSEFNAATYFADANLQKRLKTLLKNQKKAYECIEKMRSDVEKRIELLINHLSLEKQLNDNPEIINDLHLQISKEKELFSSNDCDAENSIKTATEELIKKLAPPEEKVKIIQERIELRRQKIRKNIKIFSLAAAALVILTAGVFATILTVRVKRAHDNHLQLNWQLNRVTGCSYHPNQVLKTCVIPSGITGIEKDVFRKNNVQVQTLVIPESVEHIADGALAGVKNVKLSGKNIHFTQGVNGEIIEKASGRLIFFPPDFNGIYKIPAEINSFAANAFYNCSNLKVYSHELISLIPAKFHLYLIADSFPELRGLKNISAVTIPKTMQNIPDETFKNCTSLQEVFIEEGVEFIGSLAFENCTSLTSVKLPESLKKISFDAFVRCSSLKKVLIPLNNRPRSDYSLQLPINCRIETYLSPRQQNGHDLCKLNKARTMVIGILDSNVEKCIIPASVTSIARDAFKNCSNLTSVTIPGSVSSLGDRAFQNCSNLTIELSENIKDIGNEALAGVKSVKLAAANPYFRTEDKGEIIRIRDHAMIYCPPNVSGTYTVKESIRIIASGAFTQCSKLKKVIFAHGLKQIESYAFNNCPELTSIDIPSSVDEINSNAFTNCKQLLSVKVPYGVKLGSNAFPATYREVPSIRQQQGHDLCFIDNASVVGVRSKNMDICIIPSGVKSISNWTFYNCKKLERVVIPEGVDTIGDNAFYNCSELKSVTLPASLQRIGVNAFANCSKLQSVRIALKTQYDYNSFPSSCRVIPDFTSRQQQGYDVCVLSKDGKTLLKVIDNRIPRCIIPDTVEYISKDAFKDCTQLTSIEIPNRVKIIGEGAFKNCTGLIKVSLPNSLLEIHNEAFANCSKLKDIYLRSNIRHIGNRVFENCRELPVLSVPYHAKVAADSFPKDFRRRPDLTDHQLMGYDVCVLSKDKKTVTGVVNKALEKCIIPHGVTTIADDAFAGCTNLTDITVPSTVTFIGSNAFADCSSLPAIVLPDNLQSIGKKAFYNCSKLQKLELPSTVYHIGDQAFAINPARDSQLAGRKKFSSNDFVLTLSYSQFDQTRSILDNRFLKIIVNNDIKNIPDNAFANCENIVEVILPANLQRIGKNAFLNCRNMKMLKLPQTLTVISEDAFAGCAGQRNAFEFFCKHTDAVSMYNASICLLEANGTDKDVYRAIKLLEKSSDLDNIHAQLKLAEIYYRGKYISRDLAKAMKLYEKSINSVDPQTAYTVAMRLAKDIESDRKQIFKLFQRAAKQGHDQAMLQTAFCYYYGKGTEQNYKEAFNWFNKAAASGDAQAMNSLAFCYEQGIGTAVDAEKAAAFYQKAAQKEYAPAQFNFAWCNEKGFGCVQNTLEAFKWYQRAARNGYIKAQYALGCCYYSGIGTNKDLELAAEWFLQAARKGYPAAEYRYGLLCATGEGVKKNLQAAYAWFVYAANKKHKWAMYQVAYAFEKGEGIPQNIPEAIKWYTQAAAAGLQEAQVRLEKLKK